MPWRIIEKTKGGRERGKPYIATTFRTKAATKRCVDRSRKHHKNRKRFLKEQGYKYTYSVTMYEVKK